MSSEILTKLEKYKNDLEQAINELNKTIANLKVNPIPSSKELSEIKKAEKRLANLNKKFVQANEYLNKIKECIDRDNGLKDALTRATSDSKKESIQRKVEENENTFKIIIESIEKNVNFELTESMISLLAQRKKLIASVLAAATLIGAVSCAASKGRNNTNPDASASLDPAATEKLDPSDIPSVNPTAGIDPSANPSITPSESNAPVASSEPTASNTPTGSQDSNEKLPMNEKGEQIAQTPVTEVNNSEEVYSRAEEIKSKYFDVLAPQYGVDTEYATNMFNFTNAGVVIEASQEAALDTIKTYEVLMNNEYLYAKDMRNKGESGREENKTTIDYGIFFTDGSKGQKLASKISDLRSKMILAESKEEFEKYAKEFTILFMNSWYNEGYQEISASALETAGMQALIDKLFLNTADLAQSSENADYNITVTNPLTGEEITLAEMVKQVNTANCQATMIAENGDEVVVYVNKFTYDMEGMLKEAVAKKQAHEENIGRTLTH